MHHDILFSLSLRPRQYGNLKIFFLEVPGCKAVETRKSQNIFGGSVVFKSLCILL
jgi:hypothetical protein